MNLTQKVRAAFAGITDRITPRHDELSLMFSRASRQRLRELLAMHDGNPVKTERNVISQALAVYDVLVVALREGKVIMLHTPGSNVGEIFDLAKIAGIVVPADQPRESPTTP